MSEIAKSAFASGDVDEWEDLWSNPNAHGAAVIDEGQLADKMHLVGVPFAITRVTYHSDFSQSERGYVTITGRIAPQDRLAEAERRGWIPPNNLPLLFKPGEEVKINDGSTGLRRTLTKMFHDAGVIDVGPLDESDVGASFDRPWTEWESFSQHSQQNGENGEKINVPDIQFGPSGRPLRIMAMHGLRVSVEPTHGKEIFYLS